MINKQSPFLLTGSYSYGADVVGGIVGGILQAIIGHPLDLLKTRQQSNVSQSPQLGVFRGLCEIIKQEGKLAIFKGLTPPLMMSGILNAVLFSVNSLFRQALRSPGEHPKHPSMKTVILAGILSCPIYGLVLCPIELVKIRLQVQTNSVHYTGTLDCIKQIFINEGFLGFYRGTLSTILSRIVGTPAYFISYEAVKRVSLPQPDQMHQVSFQYRYAALLTSGAVGGISFWIFAYPIDIIKTNLQKQPGTSTPIGLMKEIMRTNGLKGFYRGFYPCLLRAGPANSVVFLAYESISSLLKPSSTISDSSYS